MADLFVVAYYCVWLNVGNLELFAQWMIKLMESNGANSSELGNWEIFVQFMSKFMGLNEIKPNGLGSMQQYFRKVHGKMELNAMSLFWCKINFETHAEHYHNLCFPCII